MCRKRGNILRMCSNPIDGCTRINFDVMTPFCIMVLFSPSRKSDCRRCASCVDGVLGIWTLDVVCSHHYFCSKYYSDSIFDRFLPLPPPPPFRLLLRHVQVYAHRPLSRYSPWPHPLKHFRLLCLSRLFWQWHDEPQGGCADGVCKCREHSQKIESTREVKGDEPKRCWMLE